MLRASPPTHKTGYSSSIGASTRSLFMTAMADSTADIPVRKTITVEASPERAFRVFTDGIDTWWPREHHIGNAPLKKVIVEPKSGGCWAGQRTSMSCTWASTFPVR